MRALPASIASITLLSLWLGAALLVATVVAPAAFAVLPTRTLSGALVGRVLPAVFWSGILVGVIVSVLGWPAGGAAWRTSGIVVAVTSAIAQLLVAPRIHALQQRIGVPVASLDPADPRRQAFGRLHAFSVAWMGLGMLSAFVGLVVITRLTTRSTP